MIRKYLNSEIGLFDLKGSPSILEIVKKKYIIQTEITNNFILFEVCDFDKIVELIPFNLQSLKKDDNIESDKLEEFRETILNNDPFFKYSGAKLGEIFDAKDKAWLSKALREMRNAYIKERLEYLNGYYKIV